MVKTKAQLIEELQDAGAPLEKEVLEQMTVKELTALIEGEGDVPETAVATVRRKVNRGSIRRINKASDTFRGALKAFAEELDRQAWVEDDQGSRVGSVALVQYLRQCEADVNDELNKLLGSPAAKDPSAIE
jgi:hypothetical protein